MGRSPCCDKVGLKKGPWTPEEDQKLLAYIEEHGHGSWRALPAKAGLQRCGKSCRLRWTNYLRPDIKRGKFSLQEEQTIIQLHALLGNRWSAIATHLPKRTDNEIKNYWNTHLKKRLAKMGIDPITHKPKNDAILSSSTDGGHQSKNAANLSHMAQWESARLEAEARLVRESKLRSTSTTSHHNSLLQHALIPPSSASTSVSANSAAHQLVINKTAAWTSSSGTGAALNTTTTTGLGASAGSLESPTSTLTFSENVPPIMSTVLGVSSMPMIEFVGTASGNSSETGIIKEEGEQEWNGMENSLSFTSGLHDMTISMEGSGWTPESLRPNSTTTTTNTTNDHHVNVGNIAMEEGFTNLLLNDSIVDHNLSDSTKESDDQNSGSAGGGSGDGGSDYYEDNKNYWNSILNLVNSSPSDSPMF